jgi:parvulin-like peptidyl-prolyl isomerase
MKIVTKLVTSLALLSTLSVAQTLVTVNGTSITQQDVERELMVATQGRFNQVPAEKQADFKKQVLEQLIAKELVYGDAKSSGILKSSEFKNKFEEVSKRIKKEIAIQLWQKKEVDKIIISNADMKAYYDNNKEEFNSKSADARHILVETEAEAKKIAKKLKGLKGKALVNKFAELAKTKSIGPSGEDGGKLPTFSPREMVPEFSDKAFSMKAGTVSSPVKTQFGYHIIYLESKRDKLVKFTEAKFDINNRLKLDKAKSVMLNRMKELEKKATIK